jgi:protein SDA1
LYAAQACHSLVPEDLVDRLVRAISQAFVSDFNTPEAMAVGLNAIREIYISAPDAASEELVRDLVQVSSVFTFVFIFRLIFNYL